MFAEALIVTAEIYYLWESHNSPRTFDTYFIYCPSRAGELPKQNMSKPHERWDGKLCKPQNFGQDPSPFTFLKMNPQHTIPVLKDGDNFTLSESRAIAVYLVEQFGKDGKVPLIYFTSYSRNRL